MSWYYLCNDDGDVLSVELADEPPVESDLTATEAPTWSGNWPTPPFPEAILRLVDGEETWHDPRDLAAAKQGHWELIKQHRDQLDQVPITVGEFDLDADLQSRIDVMGAVMAMQIAELETIEWRCADNVMRTLTLAQVVAAGIGIVTRRQQLIETSAELFDEIQTAETVEEVKAVAWPT